MELSTLRDALLSDRPGTLESATILVWSCNPSYLCELLRNDIQVKEEIGDAPVYVYFQRWLYETPNMSRQEQLTYQKDTKAKYAGSDDLNVYFYSCAKNLSRRFQLHAKCCLLRYKGNGRVEDSFRYVQFSWNLHEPLGQSLVYTADTLSPDGLPENIEVLASLIGSNCFQKRFEYVFGKTNLKPDVSSLYERLENELRNAPKDRLSKIVITVPDVLAEEDLENFSTYHVPFKEKVQEVLLSVLETDVVTRFTEYVRRPTPSVIVSLFNFVDARLLNTMCDVVADPFTLPNEKEVPLVTVAYPTSFEHNVTKLHEKFVYKVAAPVGEKMDIVWLFFCSHNLTPVSWEQVDNSTNDGPENQNRRAEPIHPRKKNIEVGVMLFSDTQRVPWHNVGEYLMSFYKGNNSYVKYHEHQCRRTLKDGSVTEEESYELRQDTVPLTKAIPAREDDDIPNLYHIDTFTRYYHRKRWLKRHILPNVVGVTQLFLRPEFHSSNYTRYALYDYVFNDLMRDFPWVPGGNFNRAFLRGYCIKRITENEDDEDFAPWYSDSPKGYMTMETILDVFVLWGRTFELFDPQILTKRPVVTIHTLINYTRILRSGEPNKPSRLGFLVDPAKLAYDRSNKLKVDPYDSLSFLMQHMFEDYEVWWKCLDETGAHCFYHDVKSVFITPQCTVCKVSQTTRTVYGLLRNLGVKNIAVEFSVFKRESKDEQKKQLDNLRASNIKCIGRKRYCKKGGVSISDEDSLLCSKKETLTGFLQNFRYDIFFVHDGKLVAIEVDDQSHQQKVEKGELYEPKTMRQRAGDVRYHHRDAIKNVVSYLMGVHVVRLDTKNNNSLSLLPLLLKNILKMVETNTFPRYRSYRQLHQHVVDILAPKRAIIEAKQKEKGRGKRNKKDEEEDGEFTPVEIQNPKISSPTAAMQYNETSPISCVFSTSVQDIGRVQDNIRLYLNQGQAHAVYDGRVYPVPVCKYVDYLSLWYNLEHFRHFELSCKSQSPNWYTPNSHTGLGTLFDSDEHVGVRLVTKSKKSDTNPAVRVLWHVDVDKTFVAYTDEHSSKQSLQGVWDPVKHVRLVSKFDDSWCSESESRRDKGKLLKSKMTLPKHKKGSIVKLQSPYDHTDYRNINIVDKKKEELTVDYSHWTITFTEEGGKKPPQNTSDTRGQNRGVRKNPPRTNSQSGGGQQAVEGEAVPVFGTNVIYPWEISERLRWTEHGKKYFLPVEYYPVLYPGQENDYGDGYMEEMEYEDSSEDESCGQSGNEDDCYSEDVEEDVEEE